MNYMGYVRNSEKNQYIIIIDIAPIKLIVISTINIVNMITIRYCLVHNLYYFILYIYFLVFMFHLPEIRICYLTYKRNIFS